MGRTEEMNKYHEYKGAWKISKKYSEDLLKNVDKEYLQDFIEILYSQYVAELKMKGLKYSRNNKYIQVWDTMRNTSLNKKNKIETIKGSVRLLHQTSVQNYLK